MKTCPHCQGKKQFSHDPNPYWIEEERAPVKLTDCHVCRGQGEVSDLAHAIYVGGGAPIIQQRFA